MSGFGKRPIVAERLCWAPSRHGECASLAESGMTGLDDDDVKADIRRRLALGASMILIMPPRGGELALASVFPYPSLNKISLGNRDFILRRIEHQSPERAGEIYDREG
jgi:hypothetical protein